MDNPYRVHSSIGFGFLQLLMLSSLAYPRPSPPLYHNIALIRLMGTVYFTLFNDNPIYLKLECATILIQVICDALYIRFIIKDYTYLFGVFDIISNLLFCTAIVLSIQNGENRWSKLSEKFEGVRRTCFMCCIGGDDRPRHPMISRRDIYTSLPDDDGAAADDEAPMTRTAPTAPTFTSERGVRQPFKSPWSRESVNAKIEREFDRIDHYHNDRGAISGADGTTQYIRFDATESGAGVNHYANLFVSPYFSKDGAPITSFSGWTKADSIGACLFIYNLTQFIYQLMMYSSIVAGCREYEPTTATATTERLMRWLC